MFLKKKSIIPKFNTHGEKQEFQAERVKMNRVKMVKNDCQKTILTWTFWPPVRNSLTPCPDSKVASRVKFWENFGGQNFTLPVWKSGPEFYTDLEKSQEKSWLEEIVSGLAKTVFKIKL